MFLWHPATNTDRYTHDATRQKVDVSQSEFVKSIQEGKPVINDVMGAKWVSQNIPIKEQYKDSLKEKVAPCFKITQPLSRPTSANSGVVSLEEIYLESKSYLKIFQAFSLT